MQIILPLKIKQEISSALEKAGSREIGGILMGECLSPNNFRVSEITLQMHGGGFSNFIRNLQSIIAPLMKFFSLNKNDYKRFNYLGEWHSHPSFPPFPSGEDISSMEEIINDPNVGANFVVLMIVKLNKMREFEGTASVFVPRTAPFRAQLTLEEI